MTNEKKTTFFGGAAILMAGSILVKLIGALYKIPLLNVLGEVGYGHFMVAYTIFNLIMTITTAGLPVAISKSIAEAHTLGRTEQVQKIFRVALATLAVLGAAGFGVMFFAAGPLATWQGDSGAGYAIMALAPCVFFLCVTSAFRGYFQGHGSMAPTSASQVLEALLKLAVGLGLAGYVMSRPFANAGEQLELAAAGAILGVTTGSLAGLILLCIWYLHTRRGKTPGEDGPDAGGAILARLLRIAIPITIGSSATAIVSLIDTNQVLNLLQSALGMTEEGATGLYGTYQGCMTLYNLPSYFMVPFTTALIPAVSAARTRKDDQEAGRVAESALRIAGLLALPMGIGLCVLGEPVVALLYPALDAAVAGPILSVLGVASIFVCIMLLCNAILQANGFVNLPILTTVVGGVVKVGTNLLLVQNPALNIQGAAISTLCCFAVAALLDMVLIRFRVKARLSFLRAFVKPLAASALMGAVAWGICGLVSRFAGVRLGCLVGIAAGVAVYLALVLLLRVFSKDDLALMPKGDKIARFLRIS